MNFEEMPVRDVLATVAFGKDMLAFAERHDFRLGDAGKPSPTPLKAAVELGIRIYDEFHNREFSSNLSKARSSAGLPIGPSLQAAPARAVWETASPFTGLTTGSGPGQIVVARYAEEGSPLGKSEIAKANERAAVETKLLGQFHALLGDRFLTMAPAEAALESAGYHLLPPDRTGMKDYLAEVCNHTKSIGPKFLLSPLEVEFVMKVQQPILAEAMRHALVTTGDVGTVSSLRHFNRPVATQPIVPLADIDPARVLKLVRGARCETTEHLINTVLVSGRSEIPTSNTIMFVGGRYPDSRTVGYHIVLPGRPVPPREDTRFWAGHAILATPAQVEATVDEMEAHGFHVSPHVATRSEIDHMVAKAREQLQGRYIQDRPVPQDFSRLFMLPVPGAAQKPKPGG